MNIELEKQLAAIKGLPGLDNAAVITDVHKSTLDARLNDYKNVTAKTIGLAEAKKRLLRS